MPPTQTDLIAVATRAAHVRHRKNEQRDAEILRLWGAGWSSKKIAEDLDIKASTVVNVVHKNKAARNPRGSRTITVSLENAPIEAWAQAMLPELEQSADEMGASDAGKRAFVFACLLRLKPYDDIEGFKAWVHQVTGYDQDEIAAFIGRGIAGFLIVDGQPNGEAFAHAETDEEGGDIALVLLAGVFEGRF
jgi:hypothetical protein